MKQLKITGTLTYNDEQMHGESKEAKQWFLSMLWANNLFLQERGEISDDVGYFEIEDIKEI